MALLLFDEANNKQAPPWARPCIAIVPTTKTQREPTT